MSRSESPLQSSTAELARGVSVATGRCHTIQVVRRDLAVRIDRDPDNDESDDRFVLRGHNGSKHPAFEQTLTPTDDGQPDDDTLDLLFEDLDPTLRYTLEVDPGDDGEPYCLFEELGYEELTDEEAA